jgi:thiol-disulfide isomerase/thioredoxin
MMTRRFVLAAAILLSGTFDVLAADRHVYEQRAFEAARDAGKHILVHVTAPWCGECQLQKPIVAALTQQSEYADLAIFDVDFDSQKDALRALNVQTQSTLLIYKNKTEVTRAVGITRRDAIEDVLKKAL